MQSVFMVQFKSFETMLFTTMFLVKQARHYFTFGWNILRTFGKSLEILKVAKFTGL